MPKIEQLKQIWQLVNNSLTKEDFTNAFKSVLEFLKRREAGFNERFGALARELKEKTSEFSNIKNSVKDIVLESVKRVQGLLEKRIDNLDAKLADFEAKKDGETSKILAEAQKRASDELLPKIPTIEAIEQDLPKLGAFIRDGLELLQGKERLTMEAIDGLKEELEEIRKLKSRSFGGGGFSKIAMDLHFIDDETPTGTVNGSNTDFVLAHTPNPTTSLKVYVNGQKLKLTEDYTFTVSTRTITFLVAPPIGSIILCDYRI